MLVAVQAAAGADQFNKMRRGAFQRQPIGSLALDSRYGGTVRIAGENPWLGAEKDDTFRSGAIENVKKFIAAVREAKPVNNVEVSVDSNLTAILGRTAAYQGSMLTWDEMMKSTEKWEADLKLAW